MRFIAIFVVGLAVSDDELVTAPSITTIASTTATSLPDWRLNITGPSQVTLPADAISLIAVVLNSHLVEKKLNAKQGWLWRAIEVPEQSTAKLHNANTNNLTVSDLNQTGKYVFAVTVTFEKPRRTLESKWTVMVNSGPLVTLPPPPTVQINPAEHEMRLPETKLILVSESSSSDLTYLWTLPNGSVNNLKIFNTVLRDKDVIEIDLAPEPDELDFVLTVTDIFNRTATSTSKVTVKQEIDHKPTADAGESQTLFLPIDSVVLYGNGSYDDHEITDWTWSAAADQESTDMVGVKTPQLTIRGLTKSGFYTYSLTVKDAKGQEDTAEVTVLVKDAENKAPTARLVPVNVFAQADQTDVFFLSKSDNVLVLNASSSSDENEADVLHYSFKLKSGPVEKLANPMREEGAIARITLPYSDASLGVFAFEVTVTDNGNPALSDTAQVVVNVTRVSAPQIVTKDVVTVSQFNSSFVELDASGSKSFDFSPLSFNWNFSAASPASYSIYSATNRSPILKLLNVAVGRYDINLTVEDGHHKVSTKHVVLKVVADAFADNVVEIVIPACKMITNREKEDANEELKLDLKVVGVALVEIIRVFNLYQSDDLVMLVRAYGAHNDLLNTTDVISHLKDTLEQSGFKSFCQGVSSLPRVSSYVCLSDCNDHGVCSNSTKKCICEPFWVANPFYSETNCAWSLVYVVVVIVLLLVLNGAIVYVLKNYHSRVQAKSIKRKKRRSQINYAQLCADESNSDADYAEFHRARRKRRVKRHQAARKNSADRVDLIQTHSDSAQSSNQSENTLFDAAVGIRENAL